MVSVLLVLAFVGLLLSWRGQPAHHDSAFVRGQSQTNPATPGPSAAPTSDSSDSSESSAGSGSASGPGSTGGAGSGVGGGSGAAGGSGASSGYGQTDESGLVAAPPVTTPARAPLTVLNNSTIGGLAHQAAAQFADYGWQIRLVGNVTGRIPVSTAYYGAGEYDAAVELAREFDQVQQVLPRFTGLPGKGLTIVLTEDFQLAAGGK